MARHLLVALLVLSVVVSTVLCGGKTEEEKAAAKAARRKKIEDLRKELAEAKKEVRKLEYQTQAQADKLSTCEGTTEGGKGSDCEGVEEELETCKTNLGGVQKPDGSGLQETAERKAYAQCHNPPPNVVRNGVQSSGHTAAYSKNLRLYTSADNYCAWPRSIGGRPAWYKAGFGGEPKDVVSVLITTGMRWSVGMYNFSVYVINQTKNEKFDVTMGSAQLCASYTGPVMAPRSSVRLNCAGPLRGMWAMIVNHEKTLPQAQPGDDGLLLCEFQVFGYKTPSDDCACRRNCTEAHIPRNKAVGKPTKMSSTFNESWSSSLAVDDNVCGMAVTKVDNSSCAVTNADVDGAWWQVDLGKVMTVDFVSISPRKDFEAKHGPMRDFSIDLYDSDPSANPGAYVRCYQHHGDIDTVDNVNAYACRSGPAKGRYVKITGAPGQRLELCEVEVFAL